MVPPNGLLYDIVRDLFWKSYKISDEVKPLAIAMLTNHQSDP